ncbi:MAG TPA: cation transporter [Desulfotomaculum sp.]|nr:MAG: Cation-efflux family protein [Desulfotomaculum sp. 46_80]HBY05142.1 cation transporter [Desulfotomaculum sp.]
MEKSERIALLAIIINLFIFGIKYASASATGSIALKAEAFHTFADFIASLTVFAGLKIAKRKTKSFPYGLYKVENLLSVVISTVILYTGYEIILDVINTDITELKNSGLAIISLLVAIMITFLFSNYERKMGKKINSPILIADSQHMLTDVLSNLIVLFAVISSTIGFQLDKIGALIVVIFIARTAIRILIDGAKVLLDASVDYETLSRIEKIILGTPQVVKLKALTGRNSGRFKFIEVSIMIKTHNLDKAYFIADNIESHIKNEIKNIDKVVIHYEPTQKEEIIYALPLSDDQISISPHFGEAPLFMFVTFNAEKKIVIKIDILNNPYTKIEKGKGILAAEFLVKNMVDFVLVKNNFESKGPHYVFSNANVEVIVTKDESPKQAFEKLGLAFSPFSD